jgi:Holliday junction resolvase RusA-like endonuclease
MSTVTAPLFFTVPGPPVPWQRVSRDKRTGRAFVPQETRSYEAHVGWCGRVALTTNGWNRCWPMQASYAISAAIYVPDRRRRDVTNIVKALEDGLIGVLWDDDSQVEWLRDVRRFIDRDQPRVECMISVISDVQTGGMGDRDKKLVKRNRARSAT